MTDAEFAAAWADRRRLLADIAAEIGCIALSSVTKRAQRLGLPSRGQGALPRVSDADIEAAHRDWRTPLAVSAGRLGITQGALSERAGKLGLPSRAVLRGCGA